MSFCEMEASRADNSPWPDGQLLCCNLEDINGADVCGLFQGGNTVATSSGKLHSSIVFDVTKIGS